LVLANALFVIVIETVRRLVARRRWGERSYSMDYPSQAGGRTGPRSRVSSIESPTRR
jgi:hypothetical protein